MRRVGIRLQGVGLEMRAAGCVVLAMTLGVCAPAWADPVPPDATWHQRLITSADGTRLQTDVFRPKDPAVRKRTPAIVIVSPYVGLGDESGGYGDPPVILADYKSLFDRAFDRGYAIVQVALRGHGRSDGCPDMGGPGEQADAAAAVRWAATRRWSTGRVGSWGLSWDGYTQIQNLANRTRGLRAAVIEGPVTDLYRGHFMNGVPYLRAALVVGFYYHLLAATPPSPPLQSLLPEIAETIADTGDPECAPEIVEHIREEGDPQPDTAFWRERNLIRPASRTRVPTLWSQGFLDEQIYGESFLPVWRRLRGPHRAWLGQFPHVVASEAENGHPTLLGRDGFTAQAFRWLDAYVKRRPRARARVKDDPRVEVQEGTTGLWRAERRWPPRDAARTGLPIRPGSYLDAPANRAEPYCLRLELDCVPGIPGIAGSWTLTQALPHAVHMAGAPVVEVSVETQVPNAHLVAVLYDLDEGNETRLITRGAYLLPGSGTYRFKLYPQDWRVEAGHRMGVFLSAADDSLFLPGDSLTPVQVRSGTVRVPFLGRERVSDLPGGPSDAVRNRAFFPFPELFVPLYETPAPLPPPMRPPRG